MSKPLPPYDHLIDEDYIDMDISSTNFFCYTTTSPPQSREFEFRMSATPVERQPVTSAADELFYKGKLLPLHLPLRLNMVQKLLENSDTSFPGDPADPFDASIIKDRNGDGKTAATTPFGSSNISPTSSCYVSGELDPEDDSFACSGGLVESNRKKSWSKKLKLIKHSLLSHKLKASRAYLKSLISKSGCSDESCAVSKAKECAKGYQKTPRKNPLGLIHRERSTAAKCNSFTNFSKRTNGEMITEEICTHRRSFSTAIKWHSSSKSSSSVSSSCSSSNSSSFTSAKSYEASGTPTLKRSSSANSEAEISIKGAIAYCKMSQQLVAARKSVSDAGFCTPSASRIVLDCEKQEKSELFWG